MLAPRTGSAAAQEASVEVTLESMGVEGVFRPGGCVPMRLAIGSNLDDTASILVAFEVSNSDGDIEQHTRPAVLAPGQTVTRWLYPTLPPSSSPAVLQNAIHTVRVLENEDGVPGRELATARVSGSSARVVGTPAEMTEDLMLIVGTGRMGLNGYTQTRRSSRFVPSQNERSVLVNCAPEDLPDRWQGLSAFSTVVWSDASPQGLDLVTGGALREWMDRGGRLVIVLPEGGDPWGLGTPDRGTLLASAGDERPLFPARAPRRLDEVRIADLMQVLSKSPLERSPNATMSIRVFEREAITEPWSALAALPAAAAGARPSALDEAVYAIQRPVGHGSLVIVGIDADALQRRQLQAEGLPQTDVFWNRLVGRRGTLPGAIAYRAYEAEKVLNTSPRPFDLGSGRLVLENIRIGGPSAGVAMLLALGLFVLYWVLAGPGSYALLKRRGMVRWSWLAFTGIAVCFTGVALAGAWLGRGLLQKEAPVRHLTFLDVIDGVPEARATSWFSAYLPGYGRTELALAGEGNLLSAWSPPPNGSIERFPNSDVFQIPTDSPNAFGIPSRATSAHFVAHWRGALDERWAEVPATAERPVTLAVDAAERSFSLGGVLRHGLPWTLTDVDLICVSPFNNRLPGYFVADGLAYESPLDALPNPGLMVRLGDWANGAAVDLDGQLGGPHRVVGTRIGGDFSLGENLQKLYGTEVRDLVRRSLGINTVWEDIEPRVLRMFAMFDMLPQPNYLRNQPGAPQDAAAIHYLRWLGRGSDCSDWFLRPCLIVMATIENAELPLPLEIDGERVRSEGTIILRWIHPLPVDEALVVPTRRPLLPFTFPPGNP